MESADWRIDCYMDGVFAKVIIQAECLSAVIISKGLEELEGPNDRASNLNRVEEIR